MRLSNVLVPRGAAVAYKVFANLNFFNNVTQISWQTSSESQASICWVCSCDYYTYSPFKASVNCFNNSIKNSNLTIVHQNRNFVESMFPLTCVSFNIDFVTPCQRALIYGLYISFILR